MWQREPEASGSTAGSATRSGRTRRCKIDMSICINCDTCLRHCPPQFGAIFNHGIDVIIIPELCSGCGKCLPRVPGRLHLRGSRLEARPRRLVGRARHRRPLHVRRISPVAEPWPPRCRGHGPGIDRDEAWLMAGSSHGHRQRRERCAVWPGPSGSLARRLSRSSSRHTRRAARRGARRYAIAGTTSMSETQQCFDVEPTCRRAGSFTCLAPVTSEIAGTLAVDAVHMQRRPDGPEAAIAAAGTDRHRDLAEWSDAGHRHESSRRSAAARPRSRSSTAPPGPR